MSEREFTRNIRQSSLLATPQARYNPEDLSTIVDYGTFLEEQVRFDRVASELASCLAEDVIDQLAPANLLKWRKMFEKFSGAAGYIAHLSLSANTEEEITQNYAYSTDICRAGAQLLIHEIVIEMLKLADKYGITLTVERALKAADFGFAGSVTVPLGNISIFDLVSEKNPKSDLVSTYQFLLNTTLTRRKGGLERLLPQEPTQLMKDYPQYTRYRLEDASEIVLAAVNILPPTHPSGMQFNETVRGVGAEVIQWSKRLLEKVYTVRQKTYETLLNSTSPDLPRLKEMLSYYLQQGNTEQVVALHIANIHEPHQVIQLYRRACELAQQGDEFYSLLASKLEDHAKEMPSILDVLTFDDLPMIFDFDSNRDFEPEEIPQINKLQAIIASVLSKTSVAEYTLNPNDIPWHGFIRPSKITVRLHHQQKYASSVILFYESETGENLRFRFIIDMKKGSFDWARFINAPDDPKLRQVKNAALLICKDLFVIIRDQVNIAYTGKRAVVPTKPDVALPRKKKERVSDEVYALRKEAKTPIKKPPAGIEDEDMASKENMTIVEDKEIKRQIQLPPDEKLAKILAGIGSTDRQIIVEAINGFNEKGVGEFSRKSGRGKTGDILYTFRVNCLVRGGVRVLMHEVESTGSVREFAVDDICYRKDIYRKAGI